MTWKEFKEEVERRGVKDDYEIGYIDTALRMKEGLSIEIYEYNGKQRFHVE